VSTSSIPSITDPTVVATPNITPVISREATMVMDAHAQSLKAAAAVIEAQTKTIEELKKTVLALEGRAVKVETLEKRVAELEKLGKRVVELEKQLEQQVRLNNPNNPVPSAAPVNTP